MKREAYNHPKMLDLASRLGISRTHACGIVDNLWNWAADFAPQGDIGKWTDGVIAKACDWPDDPEAFVDALVLSGWLDDCDDKRIVIHDLEDHAPEWLKTKLKRTGKIFYKATPPIYLPGANPRANRSYERSREHSPPGGQPLPLWSSLETSGQETSGNNPTPERASAPLDGGSKRSGSESGGDVSIVTADTLRSLDRLWGWYRHDLGRSDSIVQDSPAFWVNVQAAAAKAITTPTVRDEIAVFKWLVKGRHWDYLSASHDEIVKAMKRKTAPARTAGDGPVSIGEILNGKPTE